jgi:hypothetical protein
MLCSKLRYQVSTLTGKTFRSKLTSLVAIAMNGYLTKVQAGASYLEHLVGERRNQKREEEPEHEDHRHTLRVHHGRIPSLCARSLDD